MKTDASRGGDRTFYLPDVCESRAALAIVLIAELTALVLALSRQSLDIGFWTDLARTSLFLLWIGLAGAGLLCWLGPFLRRLSVTRGSAAILLLVSALIALVSAGPYARVRNGPGMRERKACFRPSRGPSWCAMCRSASS
jgi:two-component system sensor histidine kinase AlgZ